MVACHLYGWCNLIVLLTHLSHLINSLDSRHDYEILPRCQCSFNSVDEVKSLSLYTVNHGICALPRARLMKVSNIIICSEVPVNMHVEILHVGNSILDDILICPPVKRVTHLRVAVYE